MSTNPRRAELKALSQGLSMLKKEGAIESINEGLVALYEQQGYHDLRTLYQWNQDGRRIMKGEKALLLWGRPRNFKQQEATVPPQQGEEQDKLDFYPVAYVFDITQTQEA